MQQLNSKLNKLVSKLSSNILHVTIVILYNFKVKPLENCRTYASEGNTSVRAQKVVVEALMQKLSSLPPELFPASPALSDMDTRLKQLGGQENLSLE